MWTVEPDTVRRAGPEDNAAVIAARTALPDPETPVILACATRMNNMVFFGRFFRG